MGKKLLVVLLLLFLVPLIGAVYGALHDQISYSISQEYYTKFKFLMFVTADVAEFTPENPRLAAAVIGIISTWWTGLPIGLLLGIVALNYPDHRSMIRAVMAALWRVLLVAFISGLIGLGLGYVYFANVDVVGSSVMPFNIDHSRLFMAVGTMHAFGYLGGCLGLMIGIFFLHRRRAKLYKIAAMETIRQEQALS